MPSVANSRHGYHLRVNIPKGVQFVIVVKVACYISVTIAARELLLFFNYARLEKTWKFKAEISYLAFLSSGDINPFQTNI